MHTQTQMHTHAHTNTNAHTCTHMHTPGHTSTYLYTSFRRSVCFFGCAASCSSRRKIVYSCTPWLTYKSGIKDNRSRILSFSCEIMHPPFLFHTVWQQGYRQSTLFHLIYKIPSPTKIVYDGSLACVLMEPWSSSWSRLRSGGSIWTVEDRSNVFLSIASMATCFRAERAEGGRQEGMGRGRSVKGSQACGAMKSTLLWFLFQLVTTN